MHRRSKTIHDETNEDIKDTVKGNKCSNNQISDIKTCISKKNDFSHGRSTSINEFMKAFSKNQHEKNIRNEKSQPPFRKLFQESSNEFELKETDSKGKMKENSSENFQNNSNCKIYSRALHDLIQKKNQKTGFS